MIRFFLFSVVKKIGFLSKMSVGAAAAFCFLALFLRIVASQDPNTDGFLVLDFMQKMGVTASANSSAPFCSWKVVVCDEDHQKVITLRASGLGLSGRVPENTIGKLSKLQHLDLSSNNISGLSSDIWGLGSTLKTLNLSHNRISGPLGSNIGNFGHLEALNLSHNSFEGSIPSGLLNCQALISIDFSANRLNGTVPHAFGSAFANLSSLNLARNELYGRLSDFIGLKSVAYLNLSRNLFQGPLADAFAMPLQVLDLSQNQFQGHIPQVHSNLRSFNWSALVYFDVSENQLSGEFKLFGDLVRAQSLRHLSLAHNRFSHQEFPVHIGKLLGVEYLNLSKTSLMGHIGAEILRLSSLRMLDLSQNDLTGHVPDLSIIKSLRVLEFSQNNLTGEIPYQLEEKLPQMERFNFSYNNLSLCAAKFTPDTFKSAFFGSQDDCPLATNPDLFRDKGPKHRGLKLVLAIVFSVTFFLVGLLCLAFGCRRKTRRWAVKQLSYREEPNISGPFSFQTDSATWVADVKVATAVPVVIFDKPLLNLTFADLLMATSHFDLGTLLAEGRFGPVYRGVLPGGIHVAMKVLVHASTISDQEAARELERLGQIKHPNLVPLIGYCLAGDQRIAIYEYMENGNLQNLLHDLPLGIQTTEDWSADTWEEDSSIRNVTSKGLTSWVFRHKMALGTARALAFLHHGCFPQIIHRDVKASSIYLGSEMEARLSDFGLAKIVGNSLQDENCYKSQGYMPPEFNQPETTLATIKSDVYGFGVVLFELLTGRKPIGDNYPEGRDSNLVNWVRGLVRKNDLSSAIDPKIRETGLEVQMVEALRIGYLCTADSPSKRPSMQQIVGLLKDIEPINSH